MISDEQVAIMTDPDGEGVRTAETEREASAAVVIAHLAQEVQDSRAARLRCPTCHDLVLDNPCPDCIDGYLSYADSMKYLLDKLRIARNWFVTDMPPSMRQDFDAVLTEEPT